MPSEPRRGAAVDWVGTLVVLIALAAVAVGIGLAGEYGWWSPKKPFLVLGVTIPPFGLSIAPFLIGIGILAGIAALAWGFRKTKRGGDPSAWRLRPLGDAETVLFAVAVLLLAAVDTGVSFSLYTYLPIAADLTTLQTVAVLLPKTGVALGVGLWLVYRGTARPVRWRISAGFGALARR